MSEIVIYEQDGHPVEVRLDGETVWLTQRQMADLLDTTSSNIGMHINGIYDDKELEEGATAKESLVVQTEGRRSVSRNVKHYNLDVIISVAYGFKDFIERRLMKNRIVRLGFIFDGIAQRMAKSRPMHGVISHRHNGGI